ncbi:MAG TPA: NFACT RNA binding domain-containing protein [bacterium]|nr:NFACT RNA binding domain-containing protein [bacterium]
MPEIVPPSLDGLVLAAVAREVRAHLGARFGGVRQPDPEAVVLNLRSPHGVAHLFISIHARTARVHLAARPEATERLTPFGQLLRSRLTESRLADVEQPPFDRVLRLRFDALEGPLTLIAEIMGRYSNAILVDSRVVLGALKVVTPQMSPRRPVLPGRPYTPPPADRPGPDGLDEAALRALCDGPRPIWQQLVGAVLGIGPVLAREVALRSGLDPAAPARDAAPAAIRLHATLRELADIRRTEAFSPVTYEAEGRTVAFAAVPLRVYAELTSRAVPSMSDALERYYRDVTDAGPLEERRRALASAARAALRQREHALEENRRALEESGRAERHRVMGELLLTYGGRAGPRAASVVVPDHTAGGAEIAIPLDPELTAVENAQRYFRRYAKAQAASRAVPGRIARLEAETLALRDAFVQIATASSPDDLWEVQTDLAHAGMLRRGPRARPAAASGPRRFRGPGGAMIVVGRSARENDHVTFHVAGPDDLWFHARGIAGAHVVLKTDGAPSEEAIEAAAQVAAYFSEGREAGQVAVDCVARKHVRKPRGGAPGAVTYSEERTVRAVPAVPAPTPGGRRIR